MPRRDPIRGRSRLVEAELKGHADDIARSGVVAVHDARLRVREDALLALA